MRFQRPFSSFPFIVRRSSLSYFRWERNTPCRFFADTPFCTTSSLKSGLTGPRGLNSHYLPSPGTAFRTYNKTFERTIPFAASLSSNSAYGGCGGGPLAARRFHTNMEDEHCHGHSHGHGGGGHSHSHGIPKLEAHVDGKALRQCQLATGAGLFTNVFFSVTKLWAGSAGGSVALMADGFHALTDIIADLISYASVSFSRTKLPRCRFPFGIGRLETCGTVMVAGVLFIGSFLLLWQSVMSCVSEAGRLLGYSSLVDASEADHSHSHSHSHSHGSAGHSHFTLTDTDESGHQQILWVMVWLAASSVVCKELLFRWSRRVGLRAGSRVVVANAYHHRADAWSGGVALVGVAGQYLGIPGVDGIAGFVVSLFICKIGLTLTKEAVLEFFDYQRAHEVRQVRRALQQFHVQVVPVVSQERVVSEALASDTAIHRTEKPSPSSRPFDSASIPRVKMVVQEEAVVAVHHTSTTAAGGKKKDEKSPSRDMNLLPERVRFINIFLLRHGHTYAAHLTLLACDTVNAQQISLVTERLSELASSHLSLASSTLSVDETFLTLLICSLTDVVTREEYIAMLNDKHHHGGKVQRIAAVGSLVNPSLERCIDALMRFHDFETPIQYNWEERTILLADHHHYHECTLPKSSRFTQLFVGPQKNQNLSNDCTRDAESVAQMFECELKHIKN